MQFNLSKKKLIDCFLQVCPTLMECFRKLNRSFGGGPLAEQQAGQGRTTQGLRGGERLPQVLRRVQHAAAAHRHLHAARRALPARLVTGRPLCQPCDVHLHPARCRQAAVEPGGGGSYPSAMSFTGRGKFSAASKKSVQTCGNVGRSGAWCVARV